MELRHLRYFVAVAEASSFSKAAAQLRIAQPALSRQVQALEEELGVMLFRRAARGVTLTAEGRMFLEDSRDLLSRAEASAQKVRDLSRGFLGDLHIGYASPFTMDLIPPAVAAFAKQYPQVNLVLHDSSRAQFIGDLERGLLELGVIPAVLPIVGTKCETLRSHPFCVALPPGHRLARLKSIPLKKIAAEPLVGLRRNENPGYYHALEQMFGRIGQRYRIATECDTASSLVTAIESGRGIAILIPSFKLVSGKRLVYRALTDVPEVFPIGIVSAAKGEMSPAAKNFCALLRKIARSSNHQ